MPKNATLQLVLTRKVPLPSQIYVTDQLTIKESQFLQHFPDKSSGHLSLEAFFEDNRLSVQYSSTDNTSPFDRRVLIP